MGDYTNKSTIHILGAGSIGTAIAMKQIDQDNHSTKLYSFNHRSNLKRNIFDSEHNLHKLEVEPLGLENQKIESCDAVVLCLRTPLLKKFLFDPLYKNLLPRGSTLFIISNGYVLEELLEFQRNFRPDLVLALGLAYFGCTEIEAFTYQIKSASMLIEACWLDPKRKNLDFAEHFLPKMIFWEEDLQSKIVEKWIYNCTANSIALRYDLGQNAKIKQHSEKAEGILRECYDFSLLHWPALKAEKLFQNFDTIKKKFWQLIDLTRENENSMVAHHRKNIETEHEYLLGYIFKEMDSNKDVATKFPTCFEMHQEILKILSPLR